MVSGNTKGILMAIISCVILVIAQNDDAENESNIENSELATFKKLFTQKRIIQLGAMKQLKSLGNEKRSKMLAAMTKKMFEILSLNRITLESSGVAQAVQELPKDTKVKDSLALVIENTCLASDILLNFPNYMHKIIKENRDSDAVFRWSLSFSHGLVSENIIDEHTRKLFKLALMELGVLPKEEGYVNPYLQEEKPIKKLDFADPPKPKIKPKKKLARGPRLTKSEL